LRPQRAGQMVDVAGIPWNFWFPAVSLAARSKASAYLSQPLELVCLRSLHVLKDVSLTRFLLSAFYFAGVPGQRKSAPPDIFMHDRHPTQTVLRSPSVRPTAYEHETTFLEDWHCVLRKPAYTFKSWLKSDKNSILRQDLHVFMRVIWNVTPQMFTSIALCP
jgi:hypothetical protein